MAPAVPDDILRAATWQDVARNNSNKIETICGKDISEFKVAQLRILCQAFKIQGYKSVGKDALVVMLNTYASNRTAYDVDKVPATRPRKTIHTVFRLLNILFSDEFAENFHQLGDRPSRSELDRNSNTSLSETFWKSVVPAFTTIGSNYNDVLFYDEIILAENVNPALTQQLDWKALRQIWQDTHSNYRKSFSQYTRSGNGDNNFINFCHGRIDVYYLYKHLQQRPQLKTVVNQELLPDVFADSFDDSTTVDSGGYCNTTVASLPAAANSPEDPSPRKKQKNTRPDWNNVESNLASLISNIGVPKTYFESQQRGTETRLELEKEETLLKNIDRIHDMIAKLRKEINNTTDDEALADLKKDLARLIARKDKYFDES